MPDTLGMDTCWYCGESVTWHDGFGWKSKDGYICWHERGGRMVAESHETEGEGGRHE